MELEPSMKKIYLPKLRNLEKRFKAVPNTPFSMFAKVVTLVTLNMRYEKIAFDPDLTTHPYRLCKTC